MSDWISVKDKLPKQYLPVLVHNEKGMIHVGEYRVSFWIIGNRYDFDIGEAKHWMPLPKPPKYE